MRTCVSGRYLIFTVWTPDLTASHPHPTIGVEEPKGHRNIMVTSQERSTEPGQQGNRLLRRLLSIPIFYKVLFANSLIIFAGATGGTWLATHLNESPYA